MRSSPRRLLLAGYALLLAAVGSIFLIWPGVELARAVFDSRLAGPEPAAQVWRWHRVLAPLQTQWARERIRSGAAARLSTDNISGTEWPLFGSVFFLRATESLDRAWLAAPSGERPALYAREAIDVTADLLADPVQASWVQQHWGADAYLTRENVFFRMLLIDAIATQLRLTGESPHRALLLQQVESLAQELLDSPSGLLADYPGQTFPADVAAAWHAIRRADAVLGTDHEAAASAGLRGFVEAMAPELGLPPYAWFGHGRASEVRGCANAWLLHHAPFLWPKQAQVWAQANFKHFWQEGFWLAGYREFAHGDDVYPFQNIDSGPILAGFGTSATAFGLGAARSLGARREARAIALQAIAASLPLPNGRLLTPRLLSDATDAPLLGESAMLYNLSQPTAPGFESVDSSPVWHGVPGLVWAILLLQWLLGGAVLWRAWVRARQAWR